MVEFIRHQLEVLLQQVNVEYGGDGGAVSGRERYFAYQGLDCCIVRDDDKLIGNHHQGKK